MALKKQGVRTAALLSFACVLVLASASSAFAAGAVLVHAPSTAAQTAPAVDGTRVVWHDGSSDSIRTKNLATSVEETVYSSSGVSNLSPDVSGNRVVWNRNSTEIMTRDMGGSTVSTVVASIGSNPAGPAFLPGNPAVDGNFVVWEDSRNWPAGLFSDIYGRTVGGSEDAVYSGAGSQNGADVSGNNVVWADNAAGTFDIKISKSGLVGNVTGSVAGDQTNPSISGDFVAWQDKRGNTNDIYVKNISNLANPQTKIAGDVGTYLPQLTPALSTQITVANAAGISAGDQLYISTTGASEWVTVSSVLGNVLSLETGLVDDYPAYTTVSGLWEQTNPCVYSTGSAYKVVWQDNRKDAAAPSPMFDIYMYDSATGTKVITSDPITDQRVPKVSGDTVVWQDNRNGNWDIYMLTGAPQVADDGAWTNSGSQLHASWSYPGTVTEYQYAIGTTAGGTDTQGWTSVGTSTEITATSLGLVNGWTYYFSVKAYDGSSWSDVGTADGIRVDTASPSTPTGVAASGGNGTVHVSWSAATDALSGVSLYRVYRSATQFGSYSEIASTATLSWDDGGRTNGTPYWYKVSAVDAVGNEGALSSEVSATPKAPAPTVTDGGAYTNSTSELHADWTTVSGATGYEYAIGTTSGGTETKGWTNAGAGLEVTATGGFTLTNGSTYYISIQALNGSNPSSLVGTANGILCDTQAPPAPTGVTATRGDTTATVHWTAASDGVGGSGILQYVVYRSDGGGAYNPVGTAAGTSYGDTGLSNSTAYTYKVSAVDGATNEGAQSTEAAPALWASAATCARSTATVVPPSALTLSGDLNSLSPTLTPVVTGALQIRQKFIGATSFTPIATVSTDPSGHWTFNFTPVRNAYYDAYWPGDSAREAANSASTLVNVAQTLTIKLSRTSVPRRGSVKFTGHLSPHRTSKVVYLQYKSGRVWKNLTHSHTTTSSNYSITRAFRYPGTYYVRTYSPADSLNVAGYSSYKRLRVT